MPASRLFRSSVWLLAAALAGGSVWAQPSPELAADATQAVDRRLAGKSVNAGTVALFSAADYDKGAVFTRNPNLWCADLAVYLTCFSPWNSNEHAYQGGTLVSPRNALFAEHFSGRS